MCELADPIALHNRKRLKLLKGFLQELQLNYWNYSSQLRLNLYIFSLYNIWIKLQLCVYSHSILITHDALSHLADSGQGACVLPVSIIVPLQRAPVPQGAFLPQRIIQNAALLAALVLKSIDIHGGRHGRVVLKAPSCPAAAAPQCFVCWPLLCRAARSKRRQSGNPRHVTPVVADLHLQPQRLIPNFLFISFNSSI